MKDPQYYSPENRKKRRRRRGTIRMMIRATFLALVIFAIIILLSPAHPAQEAQDAPTHVGSDAANQTLYETKKNAEIANLEPTYTEEELHLLAHVIAGEAKGCDDQEQRYVASVVLNRREHPSWPNTMEEVISQPNQYACYQRGAWSRAAKEPTERCYENARYVLENGSCLPEDVVYQAQFKQGTGVYIQTDWHFYCYE